MIKTTLVLHEGEENEQRVSSGAGATNAIQSVAIDEAANVGEDITFGSVCASKIEVTIITPRNNLSIVAGEEVVVYEEDDNGESRKKGVFIAEKPERVGPNTTKLTAYDKVTLLDKDLTTWFNALTGSSYTAFELAKMTCAQCGVELANKALDGGDFVIGKVELSSVTGRQILQWIGEICGYFCIANADGEILFKWYSYNYDNYIEGGSQGEGVLYLGGGLSYEEYKVEQVSEVTIRRDAKDKGVSYPIVRLTNPYYVTGNPFLVSTEKDQWGAVAERLYNRLLENYEQSLLEVRFPSSFDFSVGDVVSVVNEREEELFAYVMKKRRSGGTETIESTGNRKRNSATTLYDNGFNASYTKTTNIENNVGAVVENGEIKADSVADAINTSETATISGSSINGGVIASPNGISIDLDNMVDGGIVGCRILRAGVDPTGNVDFVWTIKQNLINCNIGVPGRYTLSNGGTIPSEDSGLDKAYAFVSLNPQGVLYTFRETSDPNSNRIGSAYEWQIVSREV